MAAPIDDAFEIGIIEPSFCKLKHAVGDDLRGKLAKLNLSFNILSSCHLLHQKILSEFKFLRLYIYKRNGQLRKEKSIQLLKRVQACLKRFSLGEKLYKQAQDFHKDITSALHEINSGSETCLLPARQIWIYHLYIQQKHAELLKATASYCVIAYEHLSCQFSTGMLIPQMLMFMGAVSRIWVLSNSTREKLNQAHKEIFSILNHILRAPSSWVEPELKQCLVDTENEISTDSMSSSLPEMEESATQGNAQNIAIEEKVISKGIIDNSVEEEDLGEPVASQSQLDVNANWHKRSWTNSDDEELYSVPAKKKKKNNINDTGKFRYKERFMNFSECKDRDVSDKKHSNNNKRSKFNGSLKGKKNIKKKSKLADRNYSENDKVNNVNTMKMETGKTKKEKPFPKVKKKSKAKQKLGIATDIDKNKSEQQGKKFNESGFERERKKKKKIKAVNTGIIDSLQSSQSTEGEGKIR